MLDGGTLDVAFAFEERLPPEVERLELFSEELAVAMSPRHALAGERPLPGSRLAGHALIAFQHGSSTRQIVDAALQRAGVAPRIALEANDFALVRSLVARGVGLAVLPCSLSSRGRGSQFRALGGVADDRRALVAA